MQLVHRPAAPADAAVGAATAGHGRAAALIAAALGHADGMLGVHGCHLIFHRVARTADWDALPNRGFYLTVALLDRIIDALKAGGWSIVTVDEALRRTQARAPGRFVNLSIDDAYRDTWELAVPVFRRHGVPVTLYVTTGIPDGTMPMWTSGLETIVQERREIVVRVEGAARTVTVDDAAAKRGCFVRLRGDWEASGPAACYTAFCADNGYEADALHRRHAIDWEMLSTLSRDPHVEIGAHTVSHRRISALNPEQAFAELAGSRDRLQRQLGIAVRHFAFPYGQMADCGPRDVALAQKAGFASAATTRKGVIRRSSAVDPFRLPRNTINGERRHPLLMLQAHLSGASGAASRLLGRG